MNGKFMYYNNGVNVDSETIYIPSNANEALPIGYTVTVVLGDFGNTFIFVNGNDDPDVSILVSGNNDYESTFWKFGGVDNTPGIYTIMKIDTNTWMLAGPNVRVDD
jgi:predicted phosphodiesterase